MRGFCCKIPPGNVGRVQGRGGVWAFGGLRCERARVWKDILVPSDASHVCSGRRHGQGSPEGFNRNCKSATAKPFVTGLSPSQELEGKCRTPTAGRGPCASVWPDVTVSLQDKLGTQAGFARHHQSATTHPSGVTCLSEPPPSHAAGAIGTSETFRSHQRLKWLHQCPLHPGWLQVRASGQPSLLPLAFCFPVFVPFPFENGPRCMDTTVTLARSPAHPKDP
jgi:hypothetical protein